MLAHLVNSDNPAPPEIEEQNLLHILNCSILELQEVPYETVQRHIAVWNARQEHGAAKRAAHG